MIGKCNTGIEPVASNISYDNTSSGLIAENVQNAIDELTALSAAPTVEIQLHVNSWSAKRDENGYFYQRVDVTGRAARRTPIVSLKVTSAENRIKEEYCYGYIKKVETYDGYIICRIVNMIDTNLTIELKGV